MMARQPLSRLIKEAWKLRDELDKAAKTASGAKVRRASAGVRKALEEATSAIYFKESHKYEAKFHAIIRALDPDVYRVLTERGPADAWHVAHGEE